METIVINTKNSSNAKFILELAKKLGENGKILSQNEQEDFFMGVIMEQQMTGKLVSREQIFKKLKK